MNYMQRRYGGRSGEFALDISRFAKRVPEKATEVTRRAVLSVFSEIVTRTPVDTGRLRGNWQVGIDSAPQGSSDTTDKSGDATIANGIAAINSGSFGNTFYIVNNLPYAIPIEYGHSRQAPAGMVRVSLASFKNFVDIHAAEVKR